LQTIIFKLSQKYQLFDKKVFLKAWSAINPNQHASSLWWLIALILMSSAARSLLRSCSFLKLSIILESFVRLRSMVRATSSNIVEFCSYVISNKLVYQYVCCALQDV